MTLESKIKLEAREKMYRKAYQIADSQPFGMGIKMNRFAFLHAYSMRNDAEEAEVYALQDELRAAGLDPGWPIGERKTGDDPVTQSYDFGDFSKW